jgi:hypothetical protein
MTGIHFVLLGLAAFGFLPLAIILYKRKRVTRILSTGKQAKGTVLQVYQPSDSAAEIVSYYFSTDDGSHFSGSLSIKKGTYKTGDVLDIYYKPDNPKINTVQGAWQSNGIVVFGIVIALFILFAVYKLWEMIQSGSI